MRASVFFYLQQVTANRRTFFAGLCMSQQVLPFFDSDKAATKFAIQASGKAVKEVAAALWPNKTVERAQTDLLNALNDNRESQLSSEEHCFIANFCGQYDWLHYVAHRCSHSRPVRQTPAERSAQVQQVIEETLGRLEIVMREYRAMTPRGAA